MLPPEQQGPGSASTQPAGAGTVRSRLPFSKWWPLLAGAIVGLALRLIFSGAPGGAFAAMEGAFIYLAPMLVGAVTVYVAEKQQRRSWSYYAWSSIVANTLCVLGALAILIEGLICAIIIVPLFAVLGAAGGLLMGAVCRATRWPRQAVYSFGALPLLLGLLPTDEANFKHVASIERTIVIEAPAEKVWQQIHSVRDIAPEEVGHAWMYRIGVPLPIAGVTEETPSGFVRKITMGKSVHFEQVVSELRENHYVRWTYRFSDDSFPPHALDDHVIIGGHYFDILDTAYRLTPLDAESTELNIQMSYRVSTQFNWYADAVARFLIGNFEDVILEFYRRRAVQG